jgi:hypothetical protein
VSLEGLRRDTQSRTQSMWPADIPRPCPLSRASIPSVVSSKKACGNSAEKNFSPPCRFAIAANDYWASLDDRLWIYAETKGQLGGILFLEARDLNHAITLMSRHSRIRAGAFEICPADEDINSLVLTPNENVRQHQT